MNGETLSAVPQQESIVCKLKANGENLLEIRDMLLQLKSIIDGEKAAENPMSNISSLNDEVDQQGALIRDIKEYLIHIIKRFQ